MIDYEIKGDYYSIGETEFRAAHDHLGNTAPIAVYGFIPCSPEDLDGGLMHVHYACKLEVCVIEMVPQEGERPGMALVKEHTQEGTMFRLAYYDDQDDILALVLESEQSLKRHAIKDALKRLNNWRDKNGL